jgi:hypothetical protein
MFLISLVLSPNLVLKICHEAPHYEIFSGLILLSLSYIETTTTTTRTELTDSMF